MPEKGIQGNRHLPEIQNQAEKMPPVRVRPKIDPTTKNRLATEEEVRLAQRGFHELTHNRLKIVLTPAPEKNFDGHKVRSVENQNPKWYRDFVAPRWDEKGCQIRRSRILNALKRVSETGVIRSNGYEVQLLPHIANYPERPEW
jgi:hypothetical protein